MWMTIGRRFNINLTQFAQILGLSSQLNIPKKLHSGRVIMPREMTTMYIPNSDFQAPKIDGLLPHFLVLHRMMRKTLARGLIIQKLYRPMSEIYWMLS
jgi:hypothetical protein